MNGAINILWASKINGIANADNKTLYLRGSRTFCPVVISNISLNIRNVNAIIVRKIPQTAVINGTPNLTIPPM
jgi:hypothetical protein